MKAPNQMLRAARAALGMEHVALAKKAGVSKRTLVRIETLQIVSEESLRRVQAALEAGGIQFFSSEDGLRMGISLRQDIQNQPLIRTREPKKIIRP